MIYEATIAISHIVPPFALINVAIRLCHASFAAHLIIDELSLVKTALWPFENAKSVHY
jgi:hypothetical protein